MTTWAKAVDGLALALALAWLRGLGLTQNYAKETESRERRSHTIFREFQP